MTIRKKIISTIIVIVASAHISCTNQDEMPPNEFINSVRVMVDDFISDDAPITTRTSYTIDDSGFHFQWSEGDALGIYPIGGDQVKFPISSGDGSASASFDGGAWKLRSGYQYAAYYPFSVENYKNSQTEIPVSYIGQTQDGNGTTSHLSTYDYLACAATSPNSSGGVNLTMKHLNAFLRMQLTIPQPNTYSKVVIESDGAEFVTSGTFDLTTSSPTITPTATSPTYTINLINISTTTENEVITIYAMIAPVDLSRHNITIYVYNSMGQRIYIQDVPGKNFEARKAYNIAIDNFRDIREYVDLGLPSGTLWATCNVGAITPEEYGEYYAWGEIVPKSSYNWNTYKWGDGTTNQLTKLTKYNVDSDLGTKDYKTVLDLADDAATANWGSDWRMPSITDITELVNPSNTTHEWTTLNGVSGMKLKSVKNGKTLFLPAGGYRWSTSLWDSGSTGHYWGRSLTATSGRANTLYFNSPNNFLSNSEERQYGCCVRPVYVKK